MTELRLTRSRAKHPPSKTAIEAQKVKTKVEKSNKNRRQKNMDQRVKLSELQRQVDELRRERLADKDARLAAELDAQAEQIMRDNPGMDYSAATRQALANDGRFASPADEPDQSSESMREAMQRRGYFVD